MEAADIIKKVRRIEIKTKGLSKNIFSGHYHSAFKGRGMAFSEVREYQYGDDVRNIDWNVTARFNTPYVKVFEEERELTVMLIIDVSGSNEFGTAKMYKEDMITEIAAVLAFSAINNNDKVGVIFFTDTIEKFIPPKKGTSHILRIIRELVDFRPKSQKTDISEPLRYLTNVIKKRCTAFILSDFKDDNFEQAIKIANNKHDIVALKIVDKRDIAIPNVGATYFYDKEKNKTIFFNTSSKKNRLKIYEYNKNKDIEVNNILKRSGIDFQIFETSGDYIPKLVKLFKLREKKR
ncbi:MAG: DUF58 domain-containing protein [Bacteroidales bacterium]|jgi:uncharacterized protein (DUF58 family)